MAKVGLTFDDCPDDPYGNLRRLFESAIQSAAKGDYDYATLQFTRCVIGDPGNVIYVRNFITNLQKKYDHNKKGAKFGRVKSAGAKKSLEEAVASQDWPGVIESGVEVLKINPWDTPTLTTMANACEAMKFPECQRCYLQASMGWDPMDWELN